MRVKAAKGFFPPFYGRPTMAYRHPAVSSPPRPAVYLAHAFLAIVAILEVREMNNLRVCAGSIFRLPRLHHLHYYFYLLYVTPPIVEPTDLITDTPLIPSSYLVPRIAAQP